MNFDEAHRSKSKAQCAKEAQGATDVGPCLTDAAPKDRSERTARIMTAMMPPERVRPQSSRLFWPGGSIRTSITATLQPKSWPNFAICQESKRSPVPYGRSPASPTTLAADTHHLDPGARLKHFGE